LTVALALNGRSGRIIRPFRGTADAAELAASRPQLKSGEVLKIAQSWERWVLRDASDLDLTDAF
jgi:hypothetical protein